MISSKVAKKYIPGFTISTIGEICHATLNHAWYTSIHVPLAKQRKLLTECQWEVSQLNISVYVKALTNIHSNTEEE